MHQQQAGTEKKNRMNTKPHYKLGAKWTGSVLTAGFLLSAAYSTMADAPIKFSVSFTADSVLTDVLPFPVNIHSVVSVTEILYFDQNGALTRVYNHQTEQDTFTANGKTLVGLPFTFNNDLLFDSNGNLIHNYFDGGVEKIPLPDGTLFISAGRFDFLDHPDATFIISADEGNPGNLAALTAALSP
jgi:hypothetical protein